MGGKLQRKFFIIYSLINLSFLVAMKLLGFLLRINGTSCNEQTLYVGLELNVVIIVIKDLI